MKIREIAFPSDTRHRNYPVHFLYVRKTIEQAGIRLRTDYSLRPIGGAAFPIRINGREAIVDFSDFPHLLPNVKDYAICLKFHYSEGWHEGHTKVVPFGPVSFYDWNDFKGLGRHINYHAKGNRVLHNQRAYAAARERRRNVQIMLRKRYGAQLDGRITPQHAFWRKINNCLVSVCVPGARNDMLDRGQFQYMGLGCCTISPPLRTVLPQYQKLLPGVHYVACAPDYSDLIERVEWCRAHRQECREIGANARKLFLSVATPETLWSWISTLYA
ncbi:MAG: hypothetical protein AAGB22_05910 [Bacteroidota bacterium]